MEENFDDDELIDDSYEQNYKSGSYTLNKDIRTVKR